MDNGKDYWEKWKNQLIRWGANGVIATALEYTGPFSFIGAQLLIFSAPFLSMILPEKQVDALSQMLEQPADRMAFADYLKKPD